MLKPRNRLTTFKNKFGQPNHNGNLECVNPIINLNRPNPRSTMAMPSVRYADNCRKCNFLIEFDPDIPKGLAQEDKDAFVAASLIWGQGVRLKELIKNKSIVRAVFSGSKSIHFLVSIADEPETNDQYKFCFNLLIKELNCEDCDRACKDCSRMTRKPGAKREETAVIQTLLYEDWSNIYNLNWREKYKEFKEEEKRKTEEMKMRSTGVNDWQGFIKNYLPKHPNIGQYKAGNRNQFVASIIGALKLAGCEDIQTELSLYGVDNEILEETKNLWSK